MAMKRNVTPQDLEAARNLKRIYEAKKYSPEKLTQRKVADAMGFSQQSSVSQYLLGKLPMSLETIAAFANALGVDPSEIRADFYSAIAIKPAALASREVSVRCTITGQSPTVPTVETKTEKEANAVAEYAVIVDTPLYRKAGIRKNAALIIAEGVQCLPDDDVYVELDDGSKIIATFMGENHAEQKVILRELSADNILEIERGQVTRLDVITAIENPKRERPPL